MGSWEFNISLWKVSVVLIDVQYCNVEESVGFMSNIEVCRQLVYSIELWMESYALTLGHCILILK